MKEKKEGSFTLTMRHGALLPSGKLITWWGEEWGDDMVQRIVCLFVCMSVFCFVFLVAVRLFVCFLSDLCNGSSVEG